MEQDAVAEQPPGAVERAKRLRADDAVDEHAAALLEGTDGLLDGAVEQVVLGG